MRVIESDVGCSSSSLSFSLFCPECTCDWKSVIVVVYKRYPPKWGTQNHRAQQDRHCPRVERQKSWRDDLCADNNWMIYFIEDLHSRRQTGLWLNKRTHYKAVEGHHRTTCINWSECGRFFMATSIHSCRPEENLRSQWFLLFAVGCTLPGQVLLRWDPN